MNIDYDIDDLTFGYMSFEHAVEMLAMYGVNLLCDDGRLKMMSEIYDAIFNVCRRTAGTSRGRKLSEAASCIFTACEINETKYPIYYSSEQAMDEDKLLDDFLKQFERSECNV